MNADPKLTVPTVALTVPTHAKLAEIKTRWKGSTNLRGWRITHDMLIAAGLHLLDKAIDWETLEKTDAKPSELLAALGTALFPVAAGQGVPE